MTLWIVGRYYAVHEGRTAWALGGIFDTKAAAVTACLRDTDFVAPYPLNEDRMDEEGYLEVEYPLRDADDASEK